MSDCLPDTVRKADGIQAEVCSHGTVAVMLLDSDLNPFAVGWLSPDNAMQFAAGLVQMAVSAKLIREPDHDCAGHA